jgi:ElaB/YqjD/DUF883 family membrane-anchored ribosome-binding protein
MTTKIKSNINSVKKSRDQLVDDFRKLIDDFHDLTEEGKNASSEAIHKGYDAVQENVKDGMHAMHDLGEKISDGAGKCTKCAGESISRNPWRSIAMAAVAGLILDRFLPHRKG